MNGESEGSALLRIEPQRIGHRAVIAVIGEVDVSTVTELQRALESERDQGASEIWLDFTATTFMDSSGLHVLLETRTSLAEAKRRLILICPPGPVLRLLRLAGVDAQLEVHPTRTAAQYAT